MALTWRSDESQAWQGVIGLICEDAKSIGGDARCTSDDITWRRDAASIGKEAGDDREAYIPAVWKPHPPYGILFGITY